MATASRYIVDLTEANFAEVIGLSRTIPVLVDFWADWCAPCRQISPVLEKLANEHKGAFLLAKVNADREPQITQDFGVRGLPTLKLVFQGQLAGELVGAHPEAAIRKLLQPFLSPAPPAEEDAAEAPDFHAQVLAAAQAGQLADAIAALEAQLQQDPADNKSRVLLVELLLQEDRLDEAQQALDAAKSDAPELRRARALLGFARRLSSVPPLRELESLLAGGAAETPTRYHYAIRRVSSNRVEEGLDLLLGILRSDRAWGEDAARKALLDVFEMLGREDPLTVQYRRRMASFLY